MVLGPVTAGNNRLLWKKRPRLRKSQKRTCTSASIIRIRLSAAVYCNDQLYGGACRCVRRCTGRWQRCRFHDGQEDAAPDGQAGRHKTMTNGVNDRIHTPDNNITAQTHMDRIPMTQQPRTPVISSSTSLPAAVEKKQMYQKSYSSQHRQLRKRYYYAL